VLEQMPYCTRGRRGVSDLRRAGVLAVMPLLSSGSFWVSSRTVSQAASPPAFSDPCATRVDLAPLIEGGANGVTEVHDGRTTFALFLDLEEPYPSSATIDTPTSFSFSRGATTYAGFVHVFNHGTRQHVCSTGSAMAAVLHQGEDVSSSTRSVKIKIDGIIAKTTAKIMLTIGRTVYHVAGSVDRHTLSR